MLGRSHPVDTLYGEPLSQYSAAAGYVAPAGGPTLRLSDPDPDFNEDGQDGQDGQGAMKPDRFANMQVAASNITIMGLVLIPWALFVLVMLPFALSYRHYKSSCWLVFVLSLAVSAVFILTQRRTMARPRYWLFLGILCFIATGCGLLLGLYDYYKYTQSYFLYSEARWYGNVRPNDHPGAKRDAGMLTFSTDTHVDPVKGIGFRSGSLYCVAPIVGDNTEDLVGYWAVGTDCCRSRGLFECGDVWNPNAHSAMVVFEESPVLPADLDLYRMAVDQAAAAYEFSVPENPTFVRWVPDLEAARDQFHADAVSFLITATAAFLICTTLMGAGIHVQNRVLAKLQ